MTSNTPLFTHTEKLLSMIPGNSSTSRVDMEKLLREVHKEDKIIVSNVIQTMQVLRNYEFLTNFEVIKNKKGYDVVGTLANSLSNDLIITSGDLEVLQSVSPARIATTMIQISNDALELVVRVLDHDCPLTYSTVQVSHIHKKTRWF